MTHISTYSLSFDYAEPIRRVAAFLIDFGIIFVGLSGLAVLLDARQSLEEMDTPFYYVFQMMIPCFYYAAMESSVKQGTLGKIVLKIKVTDLEGRPISFGRAAVRAIPKLIPLFWIGFLATVATPRSQAFHDLIARTLVIKNPDE